MFSQCQTSLSRQDLTAIRQQYFRDLDVEIDSNITEDLIRANLLTVSDGNFRFRYPSYYYFFAAKYLADAVSDPEDAPQIRQIVNDIADHFAESVITGRGLIDA